MQIVTNLAEIKTQSIVATMGTFDGFHEGHQFVLKQLKCKAKESQSKTAVLTFNTHPKIILGKAEGLKLLQTYEEKVKYASSLDCDYLIVLPFTKELSQLSAPEFLTKLLSNLNIKCFCIGYDHKFGKNRDGDFKTVQEICDSLNIEAIQLERLPSNTPTSSTAIRELIALGSISEANNKLTRPYSISGKVIEGKKIGRTINYPTANIKVDSIYKLIPVNGVYAVLVERNNTFFEGMLNIGTNPTIGDNNQSIEVNIFNFNEDIYGENITIHFVEMIRKEVKFNSIEALKNQLTNDKESSLKLLKDHDFGLTFFQQ